MDLIQLTEQMARLDLGWVVRDFDRGNYSNIIERLKQHVTFNPDDLLSRYYLGASYFYSGKYTNAKEHLDAIITSHWINEPRKKELSLMFDIEPDEKILPAVIVINSIECSAFVSIEDIINAYDSNFIRPKPRRPTPDTQDGLYVDCSDSSFQQMQKYLQKKDEINRNLDSEKLSSTYNMLGLCEMEILDRIGWEKSWLAFRKATAAFNRAVSLDESNTEALINLAYISLYEAREKEHDYRKRVKLMDGEELAGLCVAEFQKQVEEEWEESVWDDEIFNMLVLSEVFNSCGEVKSISELIQMVIGKASSFVSLNPEEEDKFAIKVFQHYNEMFPHQELDIENIKERILEEYSRINNVEASDYNAMTRGIKKVMINKYCNEMYEMPMRIFGDILNRELDADLEKKLGRNEVYIVNPKNKNSRIVLKVYAEDNSEAAEIEERFLDRLRKVSHSFELPHGEIRVPDCWLLRYPETDRRGAYTLLAVQRVNEDCLYEKFAEWNNRQDDNYCSKLRSLEFAIDATAELQCVLSDEFPKEKPVPEKHYTNRFFSKFVGQHIRFGSLVIDPKDMESLENAVNKDFNAPLHECFHLRYVDGNAKNGIETYRNSKHIFFPVDKEVDRWQVAAKDPVSLAEFDETGLKEEDIQYLYKRWFLNVCDYFVYRRGSKMQAALDISVTGFNKLPRSFNHILENDSISAFIHELCENLESEGRIEQFHEDAYDVLGRSFEIHDSERKTYVQEFEGLLEKYGFRQIMPEFMSQMTLVSAKFHLFVSGDKLRDMKNLEDDITEMEQSPDVQGYNQYMRNLRRWESGYLQIRQKWKGAVQRVWEKEGYLKEAREFAELFPNTDSLSMKYMELFGDYIYDQENIKKCFERTRRMSFAFSKRTAQFQELELKFEDSEDVNRYLKLKEEFERARKNYALHIGKGLHRLESLGRFELAEQIVRLFKVNYEGMKRAA